MRRKIWASGATIIIPKRITPETVLRSILLMHLLEETPNYCSRYRW